jgi:disulfide bond formation protein DsbB
MAHPIDGRLLTLAAASAAALLAALALQFIGGLPPCPFCIYQRYPDLVVIVVCLIGWWLERPRLAIALAALALLVDTSLAAYHVAIEQGWVGLPESCAAVGKASTIEELRRQLQAAPARCDQVGFTFLGLSLAAWNLLYAAGLALLAVAMLLRPSAAQQDRYPSAA